MLITSVRPGSSVAKSEKVKETSLLGLLTPIEDTNDFSEEGEERRQRHPQEAAENALIELEERYTEMVNAIDTDKINLDENYVKGYITRSEKRRGGPYTKVQRAQFLELAAQARESGDKELIRILALELCIGISPKMEKAVHSAFGNLFIHHRDAKTVLKNFIDRPTCNANLAAYIRTLLMLNRIEGWLGQYESFKHKITHSTLGKLMTGSLLASSKN